MQSQEILVKKSNGDLVPFSEEKLANSLKRSGASEEIIQKVLSEVKNKLFTGIHTRFIYKMALKTLKNFKGTHTGRYKLKVAIMEIGPSGFPFEKFIGAILHEMGYSVQVDIVLQGHCVSHEVDVIARKQDTLIMVECKFHNNRGLNCDVKVPLYINSRFQDIERYWSMHPAYTEKEYRGWVVTNTKFTTDAIQYGECMGMLLVGWNYPEKGSLRDMIDSSGLYPLTCLNSITMIEKEKLLNEGIVLCSEVASKPAMLKSIGISDARIKNIIMEASQLSSRA